MINNETTNQTNPQRKNMATPDIVDPHDIFDRAFKRLITLSGPGVLCMINGLFGTDYPLDAKVTYNSTESVDDKLHRRLADNIITINGTDSYHLEAEIDPDNDIHIRIMEYGFQHALRTMHPISFQNVTEGAITMHFPRQYLIYLGQGRNVPDSFPITILFPGEPDHIHRIPVMHFQEKKLDDLLDQKLFILLPFRLLRIRKEIEKNHSKEQVRTLIELCQNDIITPINQAYEQHFISWRDRVNLLAVARRLVRHLYEKYDEIREGVKQMRFQTLELDIDEYEDKYDALEEKLAEKDGLLAEKDGLLAEKDGLLAEKDEKIRQLEEQLAALKADSK